MQKRKEKKIVFWIQIFCDTGKIVLHLKHVPCWWMNIYAYPVYWFNQFRVWNLCYLIWNAILKILLIRTYKLVSRRWILNSSDWSCLYCRFLYGLHSISWKGLLRLHHTAMNKQQVTSSSKEATQTILSACFSIIFRLIADIQF